MQGTVSTRCTGLRVLSALKHDHETRGNEGGWTAHRDDNDAQRWSDRSRVPTLLPSLCVLADFDSAFLTSSQLLTALRSSLHSPPNSSRLSLPGLARTHQRSWIIAHVASRLVRTVDSFSRGKHSDRLNGPQPASYRRRDDTKTRNGTTA